MDLRGYVHLLRRRWRLVAGLTLLVTGLAVAATAASSPVYTATTQFFVSARDSEQSSSPNAAYQGGLFTQQRVKSYATVLSSLKVAALVREDLGLSVTDKDVAESITAKAPLDTVLLNVSVTDGDPKTAQAIAQSLGKVFPRFVEDIEASSSGGISPVKVSVVQPPELPASPTSPQPKRNLALGLVLGGILGAGAAFLRESLDVTIKSPESARQLSGAPVLGAISFDPEAGKTPLVVIQSPNSPRAEAFRQLRTNLQFVDIEHPLRSVVFTSSVPGEGKSTTTCNLAVTLAQAGLRVVLIEADLRRPRVADYMGVEGAVGLTSVLLGRVALDDALQKWGDGGLSILASGPLPPNPSELLGSAGMHDLLRELEDRFDIAIFDAPPLLPVTDAAVLGTLCSGVVMLIRSNHTRREQVTRAAETLRAVSAANLGSILNMVPTKGPDSYAYGYGYSYGQKGGPSSATASNVLPTKQDRPRTAATTPAPLTPSSGASPENAVATPGYFGQTGAAESTAAPPSPPQVQLSPTPSSPASSSPTPPVTTYEPLAPGPMPPAEQPYFVSPPAPEPADDRDAPKGGALEGLFRERGSDRPDA